ncbi:hypothetical protein BDU57DRAFT_250770 [Ampelomyces quisqualis]|uniref:J domain-containing protein n=1 Tax=Ampelomyces quisqualis TaxID=50730 RepID=A0A6A5QNL4_AMPQU|nr:hypothetical protein BDU57DRAFT_250770 [Ampelomyces quisqualis]
MSSTRWRRRGDGGAGRIVDQRLLVRTLMIFLMASRGALKVCIPIATTLLMTILDSARNVYTLLPCRDNTCSRILARHPCPLLADATRSRTQCMQSRVRSFSQVKSISPTCWGQRISSLAQEFRPSVRGRQKDTHRHEYEARRDERPRHTGTAYDPRPRYEPSPPPRENTRRYNAHEQCPPRPRYNTYDPSSPPPHSRTRYTTPPSSTRSPDLYAILNVSRSATPAEIKSAYRKSSLKHHPDRCADKDAATARMAEINMANDVLSDEGKRRVYDLTGRIDV